MRDIAGSVGATAALPLSGAQTVPGRLWRAGGIYREYYELTVPAWQPSWELRVGLGGAPGVSIGPLGDPGTGTTSEAEALADVIPVPDQRALPSLVGWGAYQQGFCSGGRAAATRIPGARAAAASALDAGDYRVWLDVYSYGPGANRLEVGLAAQRREVGWRSGEPGLGRVALEFRGVEAGVGIELIAREIGQPYLIVDAVTLEPIGG